MREKSEPDSPPAPAEPPHIPVLVVDDDALVAQALVRKLHASGIEAEIAGDASAAFTRLGAREYGAILLDIGLPGKSGLDALGEIRALHPSVEVVMMTGQGTIDIAIESMKRGAFEFLQKPFASLDHLVLVVRRALERGDLRAQNQALRSRLSGRAEVLVGASPVMRKLMEMIPDLSRTDAPILVEGESGTGKEVVARSIHAGSNRETRPFIAVNCGAIPETMIESELFGHEKGAFTGAIASARGLFRAADGGTIFLDEIGELPLPMQVKLLRALQEKEVRSVGSTTTQKVDVRVIAATNRDLKAQVDAGAFRSDLYYRLAVVPVLLPPLRDRPEDIPLFVRHFIRVFNSELPRPKFDGVDPMAMERLCAWRWPGNVRELMNVMSRAFAIGAPGVLGVEHLPEEIAGARPDGVPREELDAIPLTLDAFEKYAIERAMREAGGDANKAASILGMARSSFYRRLQRHGLGGKKPGK